MYCQVIIGGTRQNFGHPEKFVMTCIIIFAVVMCKHQVHCSIRVNALQPPSPNLGISCSARPLQKFSTWRPKYICSTLLIVHAWLYNYVALARLQYLQQYKHSDHVQACHSICHAACLGYRAASAWQHAPQESKLWGAWIEPRQYHICYAQQCLHTTMASRVLHPSTCRHTMTLYYILCVVSLYV